MKEKWKLSEYIKYLQEELDKNGDGEVYSLGEWGEQYSPPSCECLYDVEYDYIYDKIKDDVIENRKIKNIRYRLY